MDGQLFLAILLTPPFIFWLYFATHVLRHRRLINTHILSGKLPASYTDLQIRNGQYNDVDPQLSKSALKMRRLLKVWFLLVGVVSVLAVVGGFLIFGLQ